MWSATTEPSDNKQNEVADDDCQCGGSGGGGSSTASSTTINSKRETSSSFGANFDRSDAKKLLAGGGADLSGETGGDSGFISGPQTSSSTNIFHDDDGGEDVAQADDSNKLSGGPTAAAAPSASQQQQKFNIAPQQPQPQQQQPQRKQNKEEKLVLDSGCIDEDDFDDDDGGDDDAADGDDEYDERAEAGQPQQQHASATAAYQLEQQAQSEAQKLPSHANTADQMILKNNVDAGISQWFCQLSLQTDNGRNGSGNQTANSSQSQQQQVAGLGMNNLDSQRRSTGNAFSNRQQQQQQAAGNSATTTTTLTPSNAWEQFYQQNDDGDTPLHLACISGFADVVAALIRMAPHPCLFNIQNDEAQTPLHLAALTAQPKILRMLLIAGAEPTIRDRHGNTALHLACISGEEQCVRALTIPISASEINEAHRQYGHRSNDETVSYLKCANLPSDLEIPNYDGERCVHLAAQAGHIDILRILVLYGADINAREGKSGRTPLHIAIECCNEDLANFLLDECQKLNLETATYAGLTAYQVACILNKSQMQYMLEKRGAETLPTPDSDYDSSDMETDLDDSKIYNRFGDPGYFVGYNGGNPMTVA